jgi:SAM-dependent methyltransferase
MSAGPAASGGLAGVPQIDREGIERKVELERRHWWYRGRRRVLEAALARLPVPSPCEVLDLGCGTGTNFALLGRFGPVSGLELNAAAVEVGRRRGLEEITQGSAERIPFADDRFGLIACLDVIEHVEDDGAALAEAARVARPGGLLVITAPAYPRLYSAHDAAAGHRRRYTMRGLRRLARDAGWEPVLATHFNTFLLAPAALRRVLTRNAEPPRSDLLATPAWLDGPLYGLLSLEAVLVRVGVRLPAGLSILLVLRRRA